MNLTNPASNTVGISSFTVTVSNSGFVAEDCDADPVNTFFNACTDGGVTTTFFISGLCCTPGTPLPPGATTYVGTGFNVPSFASYPQAVTITTSWIDSMGGGHVGNPITVHIFDPLASTPSILVSPASYIDDGGYPAGSPAMTVTSNIGVNDAGVLVSFWTENGGVAGTGSFSGAGVTCVDANICYAPTNSMGIATVKFQPSNAIGSTTLQVAYGGWAPYSLDCGWVGFRYASYCNDALWSSNSTSITTIAAKPSSVVFSFFNDEAKAVTVTQATSLNSGFTGAYFAGNYGGNGFPDGGAETWMALNDRFGNVVDWNAGPLTDFTVTLTATGTPAFFDAANVNVVDGQPTSIQCAVGATGNYQDTTAIPADLEANGAATEQTCIGYGSSAPVPFDLYQGDWYGNHSAISAIVTGTYGGSTFSAAGVSGSLVTSTFSVGLSTTPTLSTTSVEAGGKVTVTDDLSTPQKNVPVTFYVCNATDNAGCQTTGDFPNAGFGTFNSGVFAVNATTDIAGEATAKFFVSTHAGDLVDFVVDTVAPTDVDGNGRLGNSSVASGGVDTSATQTTAGPAVAFQIVLEHDANPTWSFNTADNDFNSGFSDADTVAEDELASPTGSAVPGESLAVDVQITDLYGNGVANPGGQIQIELVASQGLLSAHSVYIAQATVDTFSIPSFGSISWTMPGSVTSGITLSATGVLVGHSVTTHATVNVVSTTPSISVTAPAYSGSLVVSFTLKTAVSAGFGGFVNIVSADYKVDSGAWTAVSISAAPSITQAVPITLTEGLHTVSFNSTDDQGDASAIVSTTVLVDVSAPTIAFTTANNANLTSGASASAVIVDTQGDLNATTVAATANGTAISSSNVQITGTNSLGHNTTYTVSLSGLTAGTWVLTLDASDLSGNAATTASITVHVSVPIGMTFTTTGLTSGSCSGFTCVNATFTNHGVTSFTAQVWFQLKNGAGQVVFITANTQVVASGGSVSILFGVPSGLASGTYTAESFVYVGGVSYSSAYTTSVTVA